MTDNDLEARKNELFATITLLAGVKRDLVGARGQRRFTFIERQAQLEADKERLSHEVNSQYMYRNLQAFMTRVDTYDAARQTEAKETLSGIAALSMQFRTLNRRMDASEADRQSIHAEIAAFRDEFQQYIAGSKRAEFAQKIADLEQRLAALEARP